MGPAMYTGIKQFVFKPNYSQCSQEINNQPHWATSPIAREHKWHSTEAIRKPGTESLSQAIHTEYRL